MAPHIIDLPIWALELGVPSVTSCSGGRYMVGGDGDAPDVQEIVWQYPNSPPAFVDEHVQQYCV